MADARYFCPDCGSIDLKIEQMALTAPAGTRECECPNCGWKGPISKTIGAATTQQFWDTQRVGEVMIRTMAIHGAGPLVQCLEFIGLLPKKLDVPKVGEDNDLSVEELQRRTKHNVAAQIARDAVMQEICTAAITAGFTEAQKQNKLFAIAVDGDIHPMFKEDEKDTIFGGDGKVVPITRTPKRKKGRR